MDDSVELAKELERHELDEDEALQFPVFEETRLRRVERLPRKRAARSA